ncbi:MAG: LPS export ABC transporter periplasmic protein LptC [Hyphomicrobiales bacterium]
MNAHDPKTHQLAQGLTAPNAEVRSPVQAAVQATSPEIQPQPTAAQRNAAEQKKFHLARRYSRRVRGLKLGLPIMGAIFIIAFIGVATTAHYLETPFGIATIDLTDGQVVMDSPTLNGFTASDSAYEIVASRALQDLNDPKKVLLEKIGATLTLTDGNVVSVKANNGKFDIEGENLRLSAGVKVHMSAGYEAELDNAVIDIKTGVLKSDQPVLIKADIGEIRANSIIVRDNGNFIFFEDRVRMVVQPNKIRRKPQS